MLDRGTHQRVEQPFEDYLSRDGLRHFDDGREVELFHRGVDRASRSSGGILRLQVWMELIELPNLSICAPSVIAITGVSQIGTSDGLEAAPSIEASREFIGQRFDVDEVVLAR